MSEEKESRSIEEAFQVLDTMVKRLEGRDITLEESFQVYQQGMDLLRYCNGKIDKVEKKMLQVNENGELSEF
ncbi:MAG: exodeoxyribonuclease VII small subunit [Lachnospiraceae bacterium]|nr:exodeoxyribonuclease VII small subunit [Lachnospiraceae bacterium]